MLVQYSEFYIGIVEKFRHGLCIYDFGLSPKEVGHIIESVKRVPALLWIAKYSEPDLKRYFDQSFHPQEKAISSSIINEPRSYFNQSFYS